jgi:hypothetical protein
MLVLDMSVLLSCALVNIVVGIIVPLYVRFGLILTSVFFNRRHLLLILLIYAETLLIFQSFRKIDYCSVILC